LQAVDNAGADRGRVGASFIDVVAVRVFTTKHWIDPQGWPPLARSDDMAELTRFHLHLVSDSTGDTVHSVARACLVQFDAAQAIEHVWSMVRTKSQIDRVLAGIATNPGLVLVTMVNDAPRKVLLDGCRQLQVTAIPVLDPVIGALTSYLGRESRGLPGKQHLLDSEYFARIDAMTFAINHDDGQSAWGINNADVCLVGVSRSSKTPTCLYLANRGVKAANVPFVPGVPLPAELLNADKPLIVGLTNDPERLIHLRRNRLSMLDHNEDTDYTDIEAVRAEVREARRVFAEHHWPVIDVTRRSIEETASSIYKLLMRRHGIDAP
jgi:regulator of PEP synthase PpsR (kinase-PPPase family)